MVVVVVVVVVRIIIRLYMGGQPGQEGRRRGRGAVRVPEGQHTLLLLYSIICLVVLYYLYMYIISSSIISIIL